MSTLIDAVSVRSIHLGTLVTKGPVDTANGATNLFTITGGKVIVTMLLGMVTTAFGSTTANTKLQFDPTATGSTFDLCTTTDTASDAIGQTYTIAGDVETPGALLVAGAVGQANPVFPKPLLLTTGTVILNMSADPGVGASQWYITYVPLDSTAVVAAA